MKKAESICESRYFRKPQKYRKEKKRQLKKTKWHIENIKTFRRNKK